MKNIIYIAVVINIFLILSFYNASLGYPMLTYIPPWIQTLWVILAPVTFFALLNFLLIITLTRKEQYKTLPNFTRMLLYINLFISLLMTLLILIWIPRGDGI